MAKLPLTPWLPPSVKPVHDGVYQVQIKTRYDHSRYARWWRGKWRFTGDTVDQARAEQAVSWDCYSSDFVGWRGLASEPK